MTEKFTNTGMIVDSTKLTKECVIGQYADYLDTGIWTLRDGLCIAPDDLTINQLRDFLLVSGGAVYLHTSGKLTWSPGPSPIE
jgi:hypothetical protein